MSTSRPAGSDSFPKSARVAIWYVVEDTFGGVLRDELAQPYWTAQIETLDERLRKRLRLLELADDPHVPDAIKEFIVNIATPEQLFALAEEALVIAIDSAMEQTAISRLALGLEAAFKEGGIDVCFDTAGKLA
jgi:hypothetical protein